MNAQDCSTHPPSGFGCHTTSSFPAAPSPYGPPHRLRPERSCPRRSQLSPSLVTQGPLLPFCSSSSRTRLACTLSLEKGGGELGGRGEEPGGGTGRGRRRGFPPSTGRGLPRGSTSSCSSSSSLSPYKRSAEVTRALVSSLSREFSGPHIYLGSHQLL